MRNADEHIGLSQQCGKIATRATGKRDHHHVPLMGGDSCGQDGRINAGHREHDQHIAGLPQGPYLPGKTLFWIPNPAKWPRLQGRVFAQKHGSQFRTLSLKASDTPSRKLTGLCG